MVIIFTISVLKNSEVQCPQGTPEAAATIVMYMYKCKYIYENSDK